MSKNIKTWQGRSGIIRNLTGTVERAMDAEITDLRAYIAELEERVTQFAADGDKLAAKLEASTPAATDRQHMNAEAMHALCAANPNLASGTPAAPVVAEGLNQTIYKLMTYHFNYGTVYGEDAAQYYATASEVADFACAVLAAHPVAGSPAESMNTKTCDHPFNVVDMTCASCIGDFAAAAEPMPASEAASDTDLNTALTVFDMGLSFALCHRDFGETRQAIKKLQTDFAAICAMIAAPAAPTDANADEHAAVTSYKLGTWFDARTLDEMQAFYMARLPAIREAAQQHGYAIGLHGSTRRDFDLMAMQWRDGASDRDTLARALADASCGIRREGAYDWEVKPCGRVATSIPICWTAHDNPDFDKPSVGHIDLSLIECTAAQSVRDAAP